MENLGKQALAKTINDILEALTKRAPKFVYEKLKNGEFVLQKGLPDYLMAQYNKCATVRTLLKRDAPTVIESIYEPPVFKVDDATFTADEIISKIGASLEPMIVSGLAGSGKSIFLKHLFRTSITKGHTFYPVFYELRSLSAEGHGGLLESIYNSIALFSDGFTKSQFEFGLKNGHIFLIIDAIDEIPIGLREAVEKEILHISRKYSRCPIVVTSRPSESFRSWEGFQTAHLLPFTKSQCMSFISKLDFPDERKRQFLDALSGDLFEDHKEFLSNPLLATMMLLTFDEYGEIPAKRHVFFDKCFQVLLREHDVNKGHYRRQFKCGLDYDELENVFMWFCVLSYLERKFFFKRDEVLEYVNDALETARVDADAAHVCYDLVNSVSVLQVDGEVHEFTHRSFQEYFYAKFASTDRDTPLVDKISEIPDIGGFDDSVGMIADMNKSYFEKSCILPVLENVLKKLKSVDPLSSPDLVMKQFFARCAITLSEDNSKHAFPDSNYIISFMVFHDEREFPPRRLNLVLFRNFERVRTRNYNEVWGDRPSDERLLEIFGADGPLADRQRVDFPLHHSNRSKLLEIGAGPYALAVVKDLEDYSTSVRARLDKQRSKLAQRLRAKRA